MNPRFLDRMKKLMDEMSRLGAPAPAYIDIPGGDVTWELESAGGIVAFSVRVRDKTWDYVLNGAGINGEIARAGTETGEVVDLINHVRGACSTIMLEAR